MKAGMSIRIWGHQLTQPTTQTFGNGHEEWLKFLTEYSRYHKDKTMTRERSNASGTVFLTNKAIYRKQNMRVYHNLMWTFGIPDFITSLVGWSVIIDYRLVISLFQQLMVTQLRILEWYPSLTARQTVNVFVPTHIALPSPDDKEKKENHPKIRKQSQWQSQLQ